ncbi:hypothetical protein CYMTET_52857 [Cymbomonas tetramitiformis]|uniref:Uncharacterized protein n=1 Tax=Cymbomonas tetramitiformis TaxID=36881 RepID=A0AAE0BK05_9CHLO|nr:hypothetical protein CYMTET_52857 [Cymbomonas tetramitiformis]
MYALQIQQALDSEKFDAMCLLAESPRSSPASPRVHSASATTTPRSMPSTSTRYLQPRDADMEGFRVGGAVHDPVAFNTFGARTDAPLPATQPPPPAAPVSKASGDTDSVSMFPVVPLQPTRVERTFTDFIGKIGFTVTAENAEPPQSRGCISFGLMGDAVEDSASVDADNCDGGSVAAETDGVMRVRRVPESVVYHAPACVPRGAASFFRFTALPLLAMCTLLAVAATAAPITGEVFGGATDTTPRPVGGVSIRPAALIVRQARCARPYQGARQSVPGGWIPPSPPISQYDSEEEAEEPPPPVIDTDTPSTSSFSSTNDF